jgi:hypothetical protein
MGVDVETHVFLTWALVRSERSASRSNHFTPLGKSPWHPLERRMGGLQSWSGRCRETKMLHPTGTQTQTPQLSGLYPAAIPAPYITVNVYKLSCYQIYVRQWEVLTFHMCLCIYYTAGTSMQHYKYVNNSCTMLNLGSQSRCYEEFPFPRYNTL